MYEVYTIVEANGNGLKKDLWIRIGTAFDNNDGSINIKLNALPLSGKLQLREPKSKEK
jgi:hypothetical protein